MEAASEAAMKQAESATKAAKTLMDAGGDGELKDLNRQTEELGKELKKTQVRKKGRYHGVLRSYRLTETL